jgi:hypothetical protein
LKPSAGSDSGQLRIAVPWLGDAVVRQGAAGEHIRLPAAEWLFARGIRSATDTPWREWLLEGTGLGAGVLERFPAGPCAFAAATGKPPQGTWACAAPVHLVAALDHLELAAPVPLPLEAEESAALLASLNDNLQGTGFRLHSSGDRKWLCECPAGLECVAVEPQAAVGRDLRQWLPAGRDARLLQARVNELQMVLHEHPVNERRAASEILAVNSIWLWGFGTAGEATREPGAALATDDDWLAGLWRLHGGRASGIEDLAAVIMGGPPSLCVGLAAAPESRHEETALGVIERTVFTPTRKAFERGTLRDISLHAGRVVVGVTAAARWRLWRSSRPLREILS